MSGGARRGDLENATTAWGERLLKAARRHRGLERWAEKLLLWSLDNPAVKAQALRFVDALPALSAPRDVLEHLRDAFSENDPRLPLPLRWAAGLAKPWSAPFAARAIRFLTLRMARRFIAGEKLGEILDALEDLESDGFGFTLDLLGEATTSDAEAQEYRRTYAKILKGLEHWDRARPPGPLRDSPRLQVSIKLSALSFRADPAAFEDSVQEALAALRPLADEAARAGALLHLDMEQSTYRDLTLAAAKALLLERPDLPIGVVMQAYLKDSARVAEEFIEWLRHNKRQATVRLVKGAYWDTESILARQNQWPAPVYADKGATDENFERLAELLLRHHDVVRTALASHNARSLARGLALAEDLQVPRARYEFQMLYGMGESFQRALRDLGQSVRVYTPFGKLLPGMAYLVRRLLENTANESFLKHEALEDVPPEVLLGAPRPREVPPPKKTFHTPPADFTLPTHRAAMGDALARVKGTFPRPCGSLINGAEDFSGETVLTTDPASPGRTLGRLYGAGPEAAERALAAAARSAWGRVPAEKRASRLEAAADILEARRWALTALEVFEVGKTWREADADVVEALDYLRYYARQARLADRAKLYQAPGETNVERHVPRGPAVVIAPWNFPLGIAAGMSSAALAAGDAMILKPSGRSSLLAQELIRAYLEAGIPADAAQLVVGEGGRLGDRLVTDPRVAVVAFTGSREVGLGIVEKAAGRGARHIKKVIAELGGKNAMIIDGDADLDEAVRGIVGSAFGYQGQKCSALSRLIVLKEIYPRLLERLIPAVQSLRLGAPEDPRFDMGPVIDAAAAKRIRGVIEEGRGQARLLFQAAELPAEGHFVPPAIFETDDPRIGLFQEEIFGPVLTIIQARDFDHALTLARDSVYALTGGLYSRLSAHIERAKNEWPVGNLYINRKITGAVVGRQPFGGFGLSGTGTKAGGPEYLLHFMQPMTITENTLRHGLPFDPENLG